MKTAGEEKTMEKTLDGHPTIKSRGLSVFIEEEEISLQEEICLFKIQWKSETGLFNTLEEAINDALPRHWGKKPE